MPELYTVSIGRNVGDTPLPANEWAEFKNQVKTYLESEVGPDGSVFGPHTGTGEWNGETEESATFTAVVEIALQHGTIGLEFHLSSLAFLYDQEAIAWTHGPLFLTKPSSEIRSNRIPTSAVETVRNGGF